MASLSDAHLLMALNSALRRELKKKCKCHSNKTISVSASGFVALNSMLLLNHGGSPANTWTRQSRFARRSWS